MKKFALIIGAICTILTMCSFTFNVGDYIQPKNRTANVRYKPSVSSTRVAILDKSIDTSGGKVTEVKKIDGTLWYKISFNRKGTQYTGWCSSSATTLKSSSNKTTKKVPIVTKPKSKPNIPSKAPQSNKVSSATIVARRGLNLRAKPSMTSTVLLTIPRGTTISILESNSGWSKTTFGNVTGWVSSNFIKIISDKSPQKTPYILEKKLAAFSTNFKGSSSGRIQNIRQTCSDLNGTIVSGSGNDEENRTFDWFAVMPETTYKNGYTMAPVISNGTTVQGMGGGLCQVTSTLYNVCLQLSDIIYVSARKPHGLSVGYVPKGRDATISRGSDINFKFVNNSGSDLKIKAYTKGYTCTVEIYSIS